MAQIAPLQDLFDIKAEAFHQLQDTSPPQMGSP